MLEVIWGMYLCTCPGFSCWRLSFSVVAPSLSDNPFALDLHPHPRPSTRWGTNATVMPPSVMPSYADICFHTGDGHPAGCPRTLSLVVYPSGGGGTCGMRTAVSCRPALHSQASPGTPHAAQVSWVPHRLRFCLVLCGETSGPTRAL